MKKIIALCFATFTLLTGCESLNMGGLSDTLLSLGQVADQAYLQYQAGVAAGQFPPSAEISEKYLQYKFLFDAFSSVLKPKATPPPALVTAKTELITAIAEAKAAAKAKKPAPTASVDELNAREQKRLATTP